MKAINQASVEISGGCNYKCISCPQSSGREKDFIKLMPIEIFDRVVRDLKNHGCQSIALQGSGEPLLHPRIIEMVRICTSLDISTSIITNGALCTPELVSDLADAGLSSMRISILGVTDAEYQIHMGTMNSLKDIVEKIRSVVTCLNSKPYDLEITLSGLLLESSLSEDEQLMRYKEIAFTVGEVPLEVWKPHNWAGSADSKISQRAKSGGIRSCGRPQANYMTIRAGGLGKHHAAVVPCCFVLGNDSAAVLGHLDTESIDDILSAEPYINLVKAHEENDYSGHSYCAACDQLYSCPDSLAYSNIPYRTYGERQQSSSAKSAKLAI